MVFARMVGEKFGLRLREKVGFTEIEAANTAAKITAWKSSVFR